MQVPITLQLFRPGRYNCAFSGIQHPAPRWRWWLISAQGNEPFGSLSIESIIDLDLNMDFERA